MSLSALDIVALSRAGFNAEQISLLNKSILENPEPEMVSTQSTQVSTQSTEPAQPTESTEGSETSTVSTKQEFKAAPAPKAQDPATQGPTMQDLFAKIAALETKLSANAINNIQQPEQAGVLTGEQVLANILDPREK